MLHCLFQHSGRLADSGSGHMHPSVIDTAKRHLHSSAFNTPDERFFRHMNFAQLDLGDRSCLMTIHRLCCARCHSRSETIDDEAADALAGSGEDEELVGPGAVGDVALVPVDHPTVGDFVCFCSQRPGVGASIGLGQAECGDGFASGHRGQPFRLLLACAEVQQTLRTQPDDGGKT